ncbi:MAG: hypothetical protein WD534_15525 [Phycisphaeraceae bacterium]
MQRKEDGGIVISCDFCGVDWDEERAMVEGHQGSVLCLDCLKLALDQSEPADESFNCTMCLQEREPGKRWWMHPAPQDLPGRNREAAICWDCVRLAAKTYHKDKDIDFRWDPADYPKP